VLPVGIGMTTIGAQGPLFVFETLLGFLRLFTDAFIAPPMVGEGTLSLWPI
jgi:hypothetical protein